jgi:carbonic anhydrase
MEVREWKEAGRIHLVHGGISRKNEKISGRMEENGRKHPKKSFHLHFAENQHLAGGKYTMEGGK